MTDDRAPSGRGTMEPWASVPWWMEWGTLIAFVISVVIFVVIEVRYGF